MKRRTTFIVRCSLAPRAGNISRIPSRPLFARVRHDARRLGLKALLILAVALGATGSSFADRRSFEDHLANLRSPSATTRARAARALGEMGRREAISPLMEAIRDPEPSVRVAVVHALRAFKDPAAVPGFVTELGDGDARVREEALSGVLDVYVETEKSKPVDYFLSLFRTEEPAPEIVPFTPVDPTVFRAFEGLLSDPEAGLRRKAATALGLLKSSGSVQALAAVLQDPDRELRARATGSLGLIGGDGAGEALVSVLSDPYRTIRGGAIDALGAMKYRPAAEALLSLYESERKNELSTRAFVALARMGAPEARSLFLQKLTSRMLPDRRWAAEGLGRMGDLNLAGGLVKDLLREPDASVQLAYCFALVSLGRPEFVDRLALSLARLDLRIQTQGYLVELGRPILPELFAYLSDPVPDVRKGVAVVLMQVGDPASIPHLEPLLSDPNADVADRANRAIARLQRVRVTSTTRAK